MQLHCQICSKFIPAYELVETAILAKTPKPWCAVESAQFRRHNSPRSQRRHIGITPPSPLIAPTSLLPSDQLERAVITTAITRTVTERHEWIHIVRQRWRH
jgi:hypothetical protein